MTRLEGQARQSGWRSAGTPLQRAAFVAGTALFLACFVAGGVGAYQQWHKLPAIGLKALALGRKHERENRPAAAAAEYQSAAAIQWTDTRALERLAVSSYKAGDNQTARTALQRAAALSTENPAQLAQILESLKDLDREEQAGRKPGGAAPSAVPAGAALVSSACTGGSAPPEFDCARGVRSSPFDCMRFTAQCKVDVQLAGDGEWFRLQGINGVSIDSIIAAAQARCGAAQWKKRLAEDLNGPMDGVCAPLAESAQLRLQALSGSTSAEDRVVPSTLDNREKVKQCWREFDECRQ